MALNIHIIGNGAMGCLWASYFQAQNHSTSYNVHFVLRQPIEGQQHTQFVKQPSNEIVQATLTDHASLKPKSIDRLIIATKAFDALPAFQNVQHALTDTAQVILIQNGMGSQQSICQYAKQHKPNVIIYGCSSTEGAYKSDADTLVHAGKGVNHIGLMQGNGEQDQLSQWLNADNFQWHDNIEPILWKKLVINCAINPLTVLYQCNNGELLNHVDRLKYMEEICAELDGLIQAKQNLSTDITDCFTLAQQVCESTANNFSSMYQDQAHKRKTELAFITGYMIKQCKELSIPCPNSELLMETLINQLGVKL